MPCYAISIREDKNHLLKDGGGFLFFKKKSLATEMCDSMNEIRKRMKLEQVYAVCKVDEKEWKDFPINYDLRCEDDDSRRDVQRYTKRTALHAGADGSQADSKGSEGCSQEGEGSPEALPL